jgi:GAF domain-containing protein
MHPLPSNERTRLLAIGPVLTDLRADPVLDTLVANALEATRAAIAVVTIALSRVFLLRTAVGLPPELQVSRAISRVRTPCDQAVREGRPVLVGDGSIEPGTQTLFAEWYGVRSFATVPVRLSGQVVGTVVVADRRANAFDQETIRVLEQTATRVEARFVEMTDREFDREDDSSEDELPLIESAALSRLALARRRGTLDAEHFERGLSMLEHMEERHFKWREMVAALRPLAQPIDPMESGVSPRSIVKSWLDGGQT